MNTRVSLKKKILFTCIVVLFTILVLEGITRIFLSDKQAEPVVPVNVGQFDSMLGWSLNPSSTGISNRTGTKIEYRINSKGIRDTETSYEKPKGVFRIVLLGASCTFGFGVPVEKHFSTLLEGYFESVEVINMGVSGFGVDQELLYLRSEGKKYKPDLVISYVPHYEDHRHMHEKRWGKKKPRFILHDEKLVLSNSPVKATNLQSSNFLRKVHYVMMKYLKIYEFFYSKSKQIISQRSSANQKKQSDNENLENEAFRIDLYELGEKLIYSMHEESLEQGATFVLVTQIPELYKASLKQGLFALDVSKSLSNDLFSLPDNLKHINESGNGVLAWEIAQFLKINQLVPPNHFDR